MKSHDFYLAIYFWARDLKGARPGAPSRSGIRDFASESGMALASCHRSLKLLIDIGLIFQDENGYHARAHELAKIYEHGVRYFFPVVQGGSAKGLPTAHSSPDWAYCFQFRDFQDIPMRSEKFVWSSASSKFKGRVVSGTSIDPLHPSAIVASSKIPEFYRLLTLCDIFRVGIEADIKAAKKELEKLIKPIENKPSVLPIDGWEIA